MFAGEISRKRPSKKTPMAAAAAVAEIFYVFLLGRRRLTVREFFEVHERKKGAKEELILGLNLGLSFYRKAVKV